jgi:uncharacterized membrane protein SpoIIM required for sporulation
MLKAYPIKLIASFMLIGALAFYFGLQSEMLAQESKMDFMHNKNYGSQLGVFFFLFSNNLKVGLLITTLGFLTGGIASFIIFFWNGYTLGILIKSLYSTYNEPNLIIFNHLLPHAFTEILAFCLFGCIGFKGFYFIRHLFRESELSFQLLPRITEFYLPIILLIVSALIETLVSSPA